VVLWEIRLFGLDDPVSDTLVSSWYSYKVAYEAWETFPVGEPPMPPIVVLQDCSTGFGQIYASTAIDARNWASSAGLTKEAHIDGDDWHQKWKVWKSLHDDGEYNIASAALVLLRNAQRLGIPYDLPLSWSDQNVRDVFALYNGSGPEAEKNGRLVFGVADVLEKYNGPLRNA
jgi:hypothetical protein